MIYDALGREIKLGSIIMYRSGSSLKTAQVMGLRLREKHRGNLGSIQMVLDVRAKAHRRGYGYSHITISRPDLCFLVDTQ